MKLMTKQTVVTILKHIGPQKVFRVTFRKANGDLREMTCMMEVPKPDSEPMDSLKALPVMDMDSSSWKSFRLDQVVELEGSNA